MPPEALVDLAEWAHVYASGDQHPAWLATAGNDTDVLRALLAEREAAVVRQKTSGLESFGLSQISDRLSLAISHLGQAAIRLLTAGGVDGMRRRYQEQAALLLGDVFVYLRSGGRVGHEGMIRDVVQEAIAHASKERDATGGKLIVVGHSMGGDIAYDLLTAQLAEVNCDVLITVGSQVALFEELGLFCSSETSHGDAPTSLKTPKGVRRWLNVFDRHDVLGFATSGVFGGAEDYEYDTGGCLWNAHSLYLVRPSFHRRLIERLTEGRP
jgi:hypothetical protein